MVLPGDTKVGDGDRKKPTTVVLMEARMNVVGKRVACVRICIAKPT